MPDYKRTDQETIADDLHVEIFKTSRSPNWYCQFNEPGKGQRRTSLKTTSKKEARTRARKIARDLEAGGGAPRSNRAATVEEVKERYLDFLATRNRDPRTIAINRTALDQLTTWAAPRQITAVAHLGVRVLENFENALRNTGVALPPTEDSPRRGPAQPLAPGTLREKMKIVRSLILWALKRDLIDSDPSRAYELPPADADAIEIFSAEERARITADPDPALADIWRFFSLTGLRANELCWLTTEDVVEGADGWELLIRAKTCPQTGDTWQPKHGVERSIPLTAPAAIEIAKRALAETPGPWLFWAPDTRTARRGQWRTGRLRRALQRRLAEVGIDHGTLHAFRHTFATFLANDPAVPLVHVQKVLGHANINTTMRYVHASPADVAGSLARVDFTRLFAADSEEGGALSQKAIKSKTGGSKSVA